MSDEPFVLYGGPLPPKMDDETEELGEIILKKFNEHGDKVIFIDSFSGRQLTASQLRSQFIRLAECLRYLGIKKGDAVGICSENRLEFPVVIYAIMLVGGIISPINPMYGDHELNHVINLTKPKIIISSKYGAQNIANVASQSKFLENLIVFDLNALPNKIQSNGHINILDYSEVINRKSIKSDVNFKSTLVEKERTVIVLVSSGTTGMPKGVEISHYNLKICLDNIYDFSNLMGAVFNPAIVMNIMPWFHAYGLLASIGTSIVGHTIVSAPRFKEDKFLEAIGKYNVNVLLAVPPILVFLSKSPLVDSYDLSSLQVIASGAAPLRKETIDALTERLGPKFYRQSYGLSETTLGVLGQKEADTENGSVGSLNGGMWGKVVDVETGKNLGPNQRGELCFKGCYIMKGYINNPTETKNTIDSNGWLHTGDIGYYDDNGEWYIVDRIKELIKYKGYQVPPAELESILLTHPDVIDAAVVGLEDEAAGELPLGYVVKRPGSSVTENEIIEYVAGKVSHVKRLHGGVQFVNLIPKNPAGKIMRRILREMAKKTKAKL